MGQEVVRVVVCHVFRQDIKKNIVEPYTWTAIPDGETTAAGMVVTFDYGFGDKTNYDYWNVQCQLADGTMWLIKPWGGQLLGHGVFKQCYLTDKDEGGTVTITVAKGWNGLCISPPQSSAATTDMVPVDRIEPDPYAAFWNGIPQWLKLAKKAVDLYAKSQKESQGEPPP